MAGKGTKQKREEKKNEERVEGRKGKGIAEKVRDGK